MGPRRGAVYLVVGCVLVVLCLGQASLGDDGRAMLTGQREAIMTKTAKTRVYMAGPYGFAQSTERFMREQYYEAVAKAGCEVVDPWRRTVSPRPNRAELMAIGRDNAKDIEAADGVVAALDGPDVDSGTAAEIGYAAARGKWIVGYRGDFRRTGESPEVVVNLQVEYFIRQSGGEIVRSLEDLTTVVRTLAAAAPKAP